MTLLTLVLLLSLPFNYDAQELPNKTYQTNQFNTTVTFRQNVCGIQERYNRGEITNLENALKGTELRTVNAISQYFRLDETGALDEEYPGLTAVLLDELARLGEFAWRDTYAVTPAPIKGKTWTHLLQWTSETYDVSVDWWANSLHRMSLGVNFPTGWYDASIIMVGKKNKSSSDAFQMWAWLAPFDLWTWCLILVTIVLSGFTYCLLEIIDTDSDRDHLHDSPLESIFLAAIAFTTHFEFKPRTHPARLFTFSVSFWAMLVAAAYTANLASFLVVKQTPQLQLNSVEDAVRNRVLICVFENTDADEALKRAYPNAKVIRKVTEAEIFESVLQGDCAVAITTVSSWEFWERDANTNRECNLEWIGRKFRNVEAGFATRADSGTFCTSLIKDVLNILFLKMKDEGFIEQAWKNHLARIATIDCQDRNLRKEDEINATMNLKNMGGIFALHLILSAAAIISALMYKLYGKFKPQRDKLAKADICFDTQHDLQQSNLNSISSLNYARGRLAELALASGSQESDSNMNEKQMEIINTIHEQLAVLVEVSCQSKIVPDHSGRRMQQYTQPTTM
eukprot:CAMPEP_0194313844 /NCGR_PEP_ID=MMETSP0171-20130528/10691_1 /TAXON_ID=218684 /ORGANISM="Corethron pennatum, Strain L29A3" /LENGTH=567 /DNA_ID=CAMNT_0039068977 /DNA_START=114 /DNA_END=1817 /DNA_ORIENTATION=-